MIILNPKYISVLLSHRAFTLVELLVSMTLFVTLMGVTAMSFQRVSQGGGKSLQVLELHTKADALLRYMESDVRNLQQTMALQIQTKDEPYTLTFMKPVSDTFDRYFHVGNTLSSRNVFKDDPPRLTDIIWVRWSWENGGFSRGQSRINTNSIGDGEEWSQATYLPNTKQNIRTVDFSRPIPYGIQNNGLSPTAQRHFKFFEGLGSTVHPLNNLGVTAALPGEKIAVYEVVGGTYTGSGSTVLSEYFDTATAPWRLSTASFPDGDIRHLQTTIECGNQNQLTNCYAVRNEDGQTVNKDRLNVLGSDEKDVNGNYYYPTQMLYLFDGVEFMSMSLYKRNGKEINSVLDEDDTLADGTDSFDISGIDPIDGTGYEKRPAHLRLSYLLHSIDLKEKDTEDYDGDGDYDEALSAAIRAVVALESGSRLDKIHSFQAHARHFGFASVLISQSVKLGL